MKTLIVIFAIAALTAPALAQTIKRTKGKTTFLHEREMRGGFGFLGPDVRPPIQKAVVTHKLVKTDGVEKFHVWFYDQIYPVGWAPGDLAPDFEKVGSATFSAKGIQSLSKKVGTFQHSKLEDELEVRGHLFKKDGKGEVLYQFSPGDKLTGPFYIPAKKFMDLVESLEKEHKLEVVPPEKPNTKAPKGVVPNIDSDL